MTQLDPRDYADLVRDALAEDVGGGDVTSRLLVPPERRSTAVLLVKKAWVTEKKAEPKTEPKPNEKQTDE